MKIFFKIDCQYLKIKKLKFLLVNKTLLKVLDLEQF